MSEDEIRKRRKGLAVRILVSRYRAPSLRELDEYKRGLIYDQSLPAQWVAHVLNPRSGELIVDMNCAPGGKLTHFAQVGNCWILGFDRSMPKVSETLEHVRRLSLSTYIDVQLHDSRYLDVDFPRLVGKVDKVLIDPPCSSLGVRPKLIDVKTYEHIEITFRYQVQFLKPAYKLLKRGGLLLYSTCTVTPLENEVIVEHAVKLGFEVEYVDIPYKEVGITGHEWAYMVARFHPHVHDTPGFFIALLRKP
jgi:16S rRNA (cytosine967-C5)-methyltransferase